mmetsp:Transcript_58526/g.130845  ORF Transcript_58526/g.130845 Transcript_58526/m.130845 type:complete len:267 (+) Transcript_58526:71-871(+)
MYLQPTPSRITQAQDEEDPTDVEQARPPMPPMVIMVVPFVDGYVQQPPLQQEYHPLQLQQQPHVSCGQGMYGYVQQQPQLQAQVGAQGWPPRLQSTWPQNSLSAVPVFNTRAQAALGRPYWWEHDFCNRVKTHAGAMAVVRALEWRQLRLEELNELQRLIAQNWEVLQNHPEGHRVPRALPEASSCHARELLFQLWFHGRLQVECVYGDHSTFILQAHWKRCSNGLKGRLMERNRSRIVRRRRLRWHCSKTRTRCQQKRSRQRRSP